MVLFVIFSYGFLYLQNLYLNTTAVASDLTIIMFVKENILLMGLFASTILMFLTHSRKMAKVLFGLSVVTTSIITCMNLYIDFSKFTLIILFLYLLIAFYFHQFFNSEMSESYYNPQFGGQLLFKPMLKRINAEVSTLDGESYSGYLTNWSKEGCFIYFAKANELKGKITVKISFQDHEFESDAIIMTKTVHQNGVGLKLLNLKNEENLSDLGWREFYAIIEDMGLKPELVR